MAGSGIVFLTARGLMQPGGVLLSAVTKSVPGLRSKCYCGGNLLVRPFQLTGLTVNRQCSTGKTKEDAEMEADVQKNLTKMKAGEFGQVTHPEKLAHFRTPVSDSKKAPSTGTEKGPAEEFPMGSYALPHPIWSEDELHDVKITHKKPQGIIDHMAYYSVQGLRKGFDVISGYNRKERTENLWVNRLVFLETVAAVPGMVAAMVRHLHSLRKMRRDHGWIHTLLEEAENERMHLMTALQLKQPGFLFRWLVVGTQGVFVAWFSLAYLFSPRYCHRFVGYLEEEAVTTYSKLLGDMDGGSMNHWNTTPAPEVAVNYWRLRPDATMKDVVLAIRADEAHHRIVNHTLGSMKPDHYNPYKPGQ